MRIGRVVRRWFLIPARPRAQSNKFRSTSRTVTGVSMSGITMTRFFGVFASLIKTTGLFFSLTQKCHLKSRPLTTCMFKT